MTLKIAFISQSGNVMKSTLAQAVAMEMAKSDIDVTVADLDKEHRTTQKFILTRYENKISESPKYKTFNVVTPNTASQALEMINDEQIYIIDCPSRATKATLEISKHVDKILMPTAPGLKDVDLTIETAFQLIEAGIPIDKILIVITRVGSNPEFLKVYKYMSRTENVKFNILKTPVYEQLSYRDSIADGYTIAETMYKSVNEKAINVINKIIEELAG